MKINALNLMNILKNYNDKELEKLNIVIEQDRNYYEKLGKSEYATDIEVYDNQIRIIHKITKNDSKLDYKNKWQKKSTKEDLWVVYDNEDGLICIADYGTALHEYEKYKKEQIYFVECNERFNYDEKVILAKVERYFCSKFIESEKVTGNKILDFVEDVWYKNNEKINPLNKIE